MKKVIIVVIILTAMLGAGLTEMFVSNNLFKKLNEELVIVEISMNENDKKYDNPDTIAKVNSVVKLWKSKKCYVFTVNNHAIMRNLDEKLITLKRQIEINADQDAPVTLSIVQNYVNELAKDSYPKITNLF